MALHNPNRKYNFAEDGMPTDGNRQSYLKRIVVPGKAQATGPEWKGDATTVLFLPYPNFDNPNYVAECDVLPDRASESANDFTKWLFYAPDEGVLRFGKNPVSLLFDNPNDSGFDKDTDHPIYLIYKSMYAAVSKDVLVETPVGNSIQDDWKTLLNGNKEMKKFEVIKRPDRVYMAYAFVCKTGDKPDGHYIGNGPPLGAGSNDLPVVFVMAKSVLRELVGVLNKPKVNDDPNSELLYPQITGSRFVHFFNKEQISCEAMRQASAERAAAGGSALGGQRRGPTGAQAEEKTGIGYAVHISETFNGRRDGQKYDRQSVAQFACQHLRPWHETLKGHTPEECADVVERVCGLPASILYHAWKARPEFYSETLKAQFTNRVTSLPPAPQHTTPVQQRSGLMPSSGVAPAPTAEADPRQAPWGGRIDDPSSTIQPGAHPELPSTSASNPEIAADVRARFRESLKTQMGSPGLVPTQAAPAPTFGGQAPKPNN